ncbi:hypothetical protein COY07_04905 [Candidatus Peregrinibacteria bacterium CG_4_10_14_0_2_um_filter_43_11]|nr:MAG: hypothetical protein COY07_04905 [Candidatus Peregrinibacteria bacterium CG_4_10_14_0_2_um_filter_43_11]
MLGLNITSQGSDCVELSRTTRESKIDLKVEKSDQLDFKFQTGIAFLDHMLEHIVWRSGFNITLDYQTQQFNLTHVVWEDVGLVMGTAFRILVEQNLPSGIEAKGDSMSCLDEALAMVCIGFEGRTNCFLDFDTMPGANRELVEDAKSWDVRQFFDGFSQGARCTIHVRGFSGDDPHHSYEAVFRAFGEALSKVFSSNPRRAGMIAGVKGNMD